VHQIPKVEKVVVNTSVGSQTDVKQAMEDAKTELALITGQRPAETRAKKSIANFKLRKDQVIGAKVTLRGERMYEFLERLIKTALPRIRDFRGVSPRCFDGQGNYTLGVSDQSIFPEVELDKIKRNIGFDVTIVTSARTNDEAKSLLSEMGMPFSDRAKKSAAAATT
jgi:large subunit ribosomal protein L5